MKQIKVCFAGDTSVGKTSIIKSYMDQPIDTVKATIAVEIKDVISLKSSGGQEVQLNVWDTAGQENYKNLVPMYFRECNVCILVCSQDSPASIEHLSEWHQLVTKQSEKCQFIIAVNKCDLPAAQAVDDSFIDRQVCDMMPLHVIRTSALTKQGIQELFQFIADSDQILYYDDQKYPELVESPQEKPKSWGSYIPFC